MNDINTIRNHYRNMIADSFIRCENINLKGYEAIEMIVKQPLEPTGRREAIIMNKWMQENGVPKTDKNGNMQQFFI